MEKQAFEPTGLIPRSIIRTVDRFVQQLLPGREKIALQEYRVSRYQILVSIKSLLTFFLIPILVSSTMKALLFTPLVEHFWNKNQSEIFLNQYQEKRAFSEMRDFSEKMFFESLLIDNKNKSKLFESENFDSKTIANLKTNVFSTKPLADEYKANCSDLPHISISKNELCKPSAFTFLPHAVRQNDAPSRSRQASVFYANQNPSFYLAGGSPQQWLASLVHPQSDALPRSQEARQTKTNCIRDNRMRDELCGVSRIAFPTSKANRVRDYRVRDERSVLYAIDQRSTEDEAPILFDDLTSRSQRAKMHVLQAINVRKCSDKNDASKNDAPSDYWHRLQQVIHYVGNASPATKNLSGDAKEKLPKEIIKFVTDVENEKYQILFQKKSLELAKSYNKQSILAITNLLGDFFTFFTLFVLFRIMRPELIILKSFLTESVYSLSDTTKSFLLILGMDLLVGFHSPRGWELLLEGFLRHIGLPENENFILLFVALFPVFLDTVFKYWIFRYLNKISPSTVVTYHSMIE